MEEHDLGTWSHKSHGTHAESFMSFFYYAGPLFPPCAFGLRATFRRVHHGHSSRLCPCVGQSRRLWFYSRAESPVTQGSVQRTRLAHGWHFRSCHSHSVLFGGPPRTKAHCGDVEEQSCQGDAKARDANGCSRCNWRIPGIERWSFGLMEFTGWSGIPGANLDGALPGFLAMCLPHVKGVSGKQWDRGTASTKHTGRCVLWFQCGSFVPHCSPFADWLSPIGSESAASSAQHFLGDWWWRILCSKEECCQPTWADFAWWHFFRFVAFLYPFVSWKFKPLFGSISRKPSKSSWRCMPLSYIVQTWLRYDLVCAFVRKACCWSTSRSLCASPYPKPFPSWSCGFSMVLICLGFLLPVACRYL